jgi:hypothetical protein
MFPRMTVFSDLWSGTAFSVGAFFQE